MIGDDMFYGFVWVLIAYFFSIVFFFTGLFKGNQEWVWYGLYCFLVGLGFNISSKLTFLVNILSDADVKYEWFDENDKL